MKKMLTRGVLDEMQHELQTVLEQSNKRRK